MNENIEKEEYNLAFIDGQNLHMGTATENWKIDFKRFRIYLKYKFKIKRVYYFLGFLDQNEQELYTRLQESGFILVFREHNSNMKGKKKGNVDVDICFEMMKNACNNENFNKIILVSGDGDYIKVVKHLIDKNKFERILFPNYKYSSLYKQLETKYRINLSISSIKRKIEYKKKKEVFLGI
ncbi:MAG: NYN domain-containing protein [Candidatus Gracilibacteria bacterium]|nr:NYN domain-containing protein [Candidatus Gracilibacteria bacterium]MDQ7022136.1 NYN domain-containing protein [Candidatus Gracilibacteria bacterium]